MSVAARPEEYGPDDGPRLGTVVADLVTALFASALNAEEIVPAESYRQTLVLSVERFIRRHLTDPDLTPRSIAAAHHISVSYLYRIFQDRGPGIAAEIRRRRLEGAHHDLADPVRRHVPIHKIAADWGMADPSAFSRQFREEFGIPPRDHRKRSLATPAADPQRPRAAEHLP